MNFKKVILILVIIFIILLASITALYIFNRNVLYNIYDCIKYIKQGIEVNLSNEYKIPDKTKTYFKGEKNIKIPILLYHEITAETPERNMAYMRTTKNNFEKQVAGLLEYGYTFISYDDLIAYNNGKKALPEKVVLVDFDDGFIGNYLYAFDIVKKYNIPINIYVVDDLVGTPGYFNWEQAKEMSDTGLVSINTHGKTHIFYNKENTETLVEHIKYAHSNIEKKLGKSVTKVFTYPYGAYTDEDLTALKQVDFVQNLTNDEINNSDSLNLYGLSRIYVLNHYSKYKILKMIK